jgi:release factor glutamine methyltransferase
LSAGEPVAYIIGYVDFLGCRIDLSAKPLIPRPETEYWAEQVIAKIKKDNKTNPVCLDIFSGSGCIGVAILKNIPQAQVVFAEKSTKFCRQIEKNLIINGIAKDRYKIIRTNIFRPLGDEKLTEKFDYILANPPYIPLERKNKLNKSVIDWEPQEALFAKDDGLQIIKRFLSEVKNYLKDGDLGRLNFLDNLDKQSTKLSDFIGSKVEEGNCEKNYGGQVWLEFDISQNLKIKELLLEGKFSDIVFHKDQYSRWRWVTFGI